MKCPDTEHIFRYANGEVTDPERKEIEAHLRECESCRKEYESFRAIGKLLTEHWDGKIEGCFDSETLAEYLEGMVSDDVKRHIEEHIAQCEICASELELMKQMAIAPEHEIEIPEESDRRILSAIMAKRDELLSDRGYVPSLDSIKESFEGAAKRLTKQFIGIYHQSELSLVESFWKMFSSSYDRDARFGSIAFDSGVSGAAGDSKDVLTPTVIFVMMGVCDYLQDYSEMPNEKPLRVIIRKNAKRFDVPRNERQKLEEFLLRKLTGD